MGYKQNRVWYILINLTEWELKMIAIKHRYTGTTLCEFDVATLKEAAEKGRAHLRGANLGGANLRGANLRGANLYGADLGGADLGGA